VFQGSKCITLRHHGQSSRIENLKYAWYGNLKAPILSAINKSNRLVYFFKLKIQLCGCSPENYCTEHVMVLRFTDPTLQFEPSSALSLEETSKLPKYVNFGSLYSFNKSELQTTDVDLNVFSVFYPNLAKPLELTIKP